MITSRQLYDDPAADLSRRESIDGVEVLRVRTSGFGRSILAARAIDYATFYVAAALTLWRLLRPGDVVVVKTDPPLLVLIAGPIARLRRAVLVNWLQDLFPEVAEAILGGSRHWVGRAFAPLRAMRNHWLRRAAMNVVLGERMAEKLGRLKVARDKIRIIPNWADGQLIRPIEPAANALRREWAGEADFVVAYSGNLGRAHEFETFLDAAGRLEAGHLAAPAAEPGAQASLHALLAPARTRAAGMATRPRIAWQFIGGGAQHKALAAEVARRGLRSIGVKPYQPRSRLAESLSAGDVHLVTLRTELEGLIVPSKYYGICAAGRPVIFVGDPDGEIARLLARDGSGFVSQPGEGARLAELIATLAGDPALVARLGANARAAFEARYDMAHAVEAWMALLAEIAADGKGSG